MTWYRRILNRRAVVTALFLQVCGCGARSEAQPQPLGIMDWGNRFATSEGGNQLNLSVDAAPGETVAWTLQPEIGALSQISPTMVVYTPPDTVQRRDAFTAVTLTARTPSGRGTEELRVYPDPCGAGGRWYINYPSTMPPPPDGCGLCGPSVFYGDETPPAELLLGGSVVGGVVETFDVSTCTYTVTAPSGGIINGNEVPASYAGVTLNVTFGGGQSTLNGQERVVCQGATGRCTPLLDITLSRQ